MMESREKKVDGPSPASNDGGDKKPGGFGDMSGPKEFDRSEAQKEHGVKESQSEFEKHAPKEANKPKDGL